MAVTLSIIIPAYNEAHRLPPYLDVIRPYVRRRYGDAYEVIVVDDGSIDGLADVLAPIADGWPQLTVMRHPANRGKGAAVRSGMLAAAGETLLFADADGATPIDQEAGLRQAISDGADVAIGSRLVDGNGVSRRRSWHRGLAGRLFAAMARWLLGISVRDTQCGFKMFRREPGRELFSRSQETGYLFDLELLVLADRCDYRIAEVPVNWSDIPGGHLSLTRHLFKILVGLWRVRRRLRR